MSFLPQCLCAHALAVAILSPNPTDGVGGSPTVSLVAESTDEVSALELEVTLLWSFAEARDLQIDLDAIFEGLELDDDIATFAKGVIAFDGAATTAIEGSLAFTLGIGLQYVKESGDIRPYIKGTTGKWQQTAPVLH